MLIGRNIFRQSTLLCWVFALSSTSTAVVCDGGLWFVLESGFFRIGKSVLFFFLLLLHVILIIRGILRDNRAAIKRFDHHSYSNICTISINHFYSSKSTILNTASFPALNLPGCFFICSLNAASSSVWRSSPSSYDARPHPIMSPSFKRTGAFLKFKHS